MKSIRKFVWDVSSQTGSFRGKERIVTMLARPGGRDDVTVTRQGVRWSIVGHDLNEFAIAVRKNHSPLLSNFLEKEIRSGGIRTFWDIGANIGAIALPLVRQFENLRAVLFEPSAEVAGRLIRNVTNNPEIASRISLFNLALSDSNGIANFYVSNETLNSGVAGLGKSHNRYQIPVSVQSYTGDAIIAAGRCTVPELIKIDVEGFEREVFLGLEQTLRKFHPTIVFEHAIYRLEERNLRNSEVVDMLREFGYGVYRIADGVKVGNEDLKADADFVARKMVVS